MPTAIPSEPLTRRPEIRVGELLALRPVHPSSGTNRTVSLSMSARYSSASFHSRFGVPISRSRIPIDRSRSCLARRQGGSACSKAGPCEPRRRKPPNLHVDGTSLEPHPRHPHAWNTCDSKEDLLDTLHTECSDRQARSISNIRKARPMMTDME